MTKIDKLIAKLKKARVPVTIRDSRKEVRPGALMTEVSVVHKTAGCVLASSYFVGSIESHMPNNKRLREFF